ncbi:hypothetical protein T4D_3443 [Trichinella pseudospiralis]|uniref:Uncharacterized protein n=1 Tax=Trichinella pseudospiralis TaxID=6337 RepID=A0A0V1F3K8_TRIPS|nr:hypothetical protein T4D_957 [Trichinella pseudospiralis]KRY80585.1 hypothetical protein T4D_10260 [Trichinella pseudospiralis]KRY80701.1 hypothetical protein T4D_3443 [Trichinella pseudospiralis]
MYSDLLRLARCILRKLRSRRSYQPDHVITIKSVIHSDALRCLNSRFFVFSVEHYLQRVPQRIRIHASEYAKNVSDIHFCTFMYQDIIFKDSNLLLAEILFTTGIACSSSIKRITYDLVLHRFITLVLETCSAVTLPIPTGVSLL